MSEQQFDPQEWVTTAKAANMVGCTPQNLTRAFRSGDLRAVKLGRMLFFQPDDVFRYIQEMQDMGNDKHTPKVYRKDRLQ